MIYFDTSDMAVLQALYNLKSANPEYYDIYTETCKINDDLLHSTVLDTLKDLVYHGYLDQNKDCYSLTAKGVDLCITLFS